MKAIDVEEFAQICLDIEKDQKGQGNYANALFISELGKMISTYPTVDAVPVKHGRWIPVLNGIDDDTNPAFDCSECDAMCNKKHNYCPACGAKMDLDEDHTGQKTEIESHLYNEDEAADNMRDYCERYEPTYNTEDGSM